MKKILILLGLIITSAPLWAQGGRPNPGRRVQMEKDSLLVKVTSLSDDQKFLIESVYTDFQASVKSLMEHGREDPEAFRAALRSANEEKNGLLKEILNEAQWTEYEAMMKAIRERRRSRRGQREGRSGSRSGQ